MMHAIFGFLFDAVGGKALVALGGFVALLAWWQVDQSRVYNQGARDAKSSITEQASKSEKQLTDNARAARDAVDGSDPYERLRRSWCTDCGTAADRHRDR